VKYSIAICDDDETQIIVLKKHIEKVMRQHKYHVNLEAFNCGEDLVESIVAKGEDVHIIYLDMEMQGKNGLEVGKIIKRYNPNIIIVFVTGFRDFALEAYEVRPLDYLLKPINKNKFEKVMVEAIQKVDENVKFKELQSSIISISINKKIVTLNTEDILFIEKKVNKLLIHCQGKDIEFYASLASIYEQLDKIHFFKCHEGYIINLRKIRKYEKACVRLCSGDCIPVSRSNAKEMKKIIIERIGI
jgi:DNA-binding LytR/AlgR family response regulator